MKKHKWHKEIKAWADGAVIEYCVCKGKWKDDYSPSWIIDDEIEYRIKPQEQQSCCCCKQTCSVPKEPQYLYVWLDKDRGLPQLEIERPAGILEDDVYKYIGKIKLEVDDVSSS